MAPVLCTCTLMFNKKKYQLSAFFVFSCLNCTIAICRPFCPSFDSQMQLTKTWLATEFLKLYHESHVGRTGKCIILETDHVQVNWKPGSDWPIFGLGYFLGLWAWYLTQLLNHPLFDSFGSWVHYPKDIPINFTFANFCLVHNNGNVIGIWRDC